MRLELRQLAGVAAVGLCLAATPARAVEVSPLFGLQVLGGQYFFGGDRGNLTGNVSAVAAPALKFDERWALLPSVQSSYQGTKQVVDLVGAGTLFQEQMDHRAGVKAVYTPEGSSWRLKPSVNFRYQLLKETKDEDWGSGLFDYRRVGLGFEGEYVIRDPFSLRLGADYYKVEFPNYQSLESKASEQFTGLSRELVGDKVLDNDNLLVSSSLELPIGDRLIGEAGVLANYGRFPQQGIVDQSGNTTASRREDLYGAVSVGAKMPMEHNADLRTLGGLTLAYTVMTSNQNNFDAQRAQFTPLYYNYTELRAAPSFKAFFGRRRLKQPIVAGLSVNVWWRNYGHRLIQDGSGVYQSDTLYTLNWMTSASLTYPMAKRFNLVFNLQHGRAHSNQRFESFYKYNYSVTNYLFGFSYDY